MKAAKHIAGVFVRRLLSLKGRGDRTPKLLRSSLDAERDARQYDVIWSKSGFVEQYLTPQRVAFYQAVCEYASERVDLNAIRSLADVGCGPGFLLALFSKRIPDARLVGLDFSEQVLEAARRLSGTAEFRTHDIYNDLNESFDVVVCSEVLEHLDYPRKALEKLLKASPILITTVPNGRTDNYLGHINFWSKRSWEVFLEPYVEEYECDISFLCGETKIITIMRKRTSLET